MNSHLGPEMHGFCVANLGNSSLLPAIFALKPHISDTNLLRPDLISGSLTGSRNPAIRKRQAEQGLTPTRFRDGSNTVATRPPQFKIQHSKFISDYSAPHP
jgi:hypothetical protein